MSAVILSEAAFFAVSFAAGALLLSGYDILRAFRRAFSHSARWIALEDFVYWCAAGIYLFLLFYEKNNGEIRGYAHAALGIGMLVYHFTLQNGVLKIFSAFFRGIRLGIAGFFRLLLLPAGKSFKKMRKIVRKTLKNKIKRVRMVIDKK